MRKIPWALLMASVFFLPLLMEGAESQEQAVLITNIEVVTVGDDEAVVTWVTNLESTSEVSYGEDESMGNTAAADGETRYHYVMVQDLSPETLYYFQVSSGSARGRMGSFTTLPLLKTAPSERIAILADVHYDVDGTNMPNGAMYGNSVGLLDSFLDEISMRGDIDTVILLGDNVQGSEEDYSGFYDTMASSGLTCYPTMGNWDKSEVGWEDYYVTYVGSENTYYSFDLGDLHFMILDSAVSGSTGGSIDEEQLDWLDNDLQDHLSSKVLIFMHHLFIEDDVMGLDTDSYDRLVDATSEHGNVLSIISGHNHQNSYDEVPSPFKTTIASLVQYPIGYATLDLYRDGFSQSFWKVGSALEISENSRMRIKASSVDPEADQEFLGTIDERNHVLEQEEPVENEPPVILSVSLKDDVIELGEETTVTVNAYDPEDEALEYIYDADGGTIVGDGPIATYTAPDYEGTLDIEVKVFDGVLYSDPFVVNIEVEEAPVVHDNNAPEVDRAIATPQRVVSGGNVSIRTIASDPDGDPLEYIYQCSSGQIMGEGSEIIWKAPEKKGLYVITVRVSDGEMASDSYSVEVEVYEQETTSTDDSPFIPLPALVLMTSLIALSFIFWGRRRRN